MISIDSEISRLWNGTSVSLGLSREAATTLRELTRKPLWRGPEGVAANVGLNVTRESVRSLLRYFSSLPNDEFRVAESMLDAACQLVMPPVVALLDVVTEGGSLGEVPGRWYRPRGGPIRASILYFHGGGYVGTTPMMYAPFVALLARRTMSEVFVVDYRLAPEFPFPAAMDDAIAVLTAAFDSGIAPAKLFIAGDSAGGGLATALMCATEMNSLPTVAGLVLLSPEVDLRLDKPSMLANAALDILPADVPTTAYLQGVDPGLRCVSVIEHEISRWPPTLISFGGDEIFRDSIRLLVDRLRNAQVDTVALEEPGMFHVFPILVPWTSASRRVFDAIEIFTARAGAADGASSASPGTAAGRGPRTGHHR